MAAEKDLNNNGSMDLFNNTGVDQYFDDIFDSEQFISDEFEIEEVGVDTVASSEDLWDILDITDEDWDAANDGGFLMP